MNIENKQQFTQLIQSNIVQHGFHLTVVGSSVVPRYAYTIGLTEQLNFELVFAGGTIYLYKDLVQVFNEIVSKLTQNSTGDITPEILTSLGSFSLLPVDASGAGC